MEGRVKMSGGVKPLTRIEWEKRKVVKRKGKGKRQKKERERKGYNENN